MTAASPIDSFVVVGASHRSSALSLRGRLLIEEAALPRFLAQLHAAGLNDVVAVTAGDRIEILARAGDPAQAILAVRQALAAQAGLDAAGLQGQLHAFQGAEAVGHLFTAAAGLDSLVPGDTDIAARLVAARDIARRCGTIGEGLESVIASALATAARVAAETGLAARPASIAAAAVRVARDIHGDLARTSALVLGPGEMGERLTQGLLDAGLKNLVLTGRSATVLEQAARRLRCEVVPLESLDEALARADIVVAAMGSSPPAITLSMVRAALKKRRQKPIFLIDAAIPGDIDLAAGNEEDAFLYGLDDLEQVVMEGGAEREAAAEAAAEIVAAEVAHFMVEAKDPGSDAALALLRRRFEATRLAVLEEMPGNPAAATKTLIDRLLPQVAALINEASRRAAALRRDGAKPSEKAPPAGKKGNTT